MNDENKDDNLVENATEGSSEPEIEIVDEALEPVAQDAAEPVAPVVDEDEQRQKKHISLKTKFNQVQRDKLRAEHEAAQLRQELEKYRSIAEKNSEAAMGHYDQLIESQIIQAKSEKRAAKESGDYDAELAADEKLARAIAQKTQNENWRMQQKYLKEQQVQQAEQEPPQTQEYEDFVPNEINDEAKDWLNRNPWFISKNEEDQVLAKEVQAYSEMLEMRYRRQGLEDELFSKSYFDDIDNYVKSQIQGEPLNPLANSTQRNNINMKPVRNAAPVGRNPKGPDAPARRTVSLSAQEKEMARIMNIPEQDYAKWKIKDQEKQAAKGRPY